MKTVKAKQIHVKYLHDLIAGRASLAPLGGIGEEYRRI